MAISFGHKDNKWRSKYSFSAKSMMSSVRNFLSKGASTGVHKHNEGDVNKFYGVTYNSLLGVAFNDNPSSNKVFKSMSIEGSESLKNKIHDFAPATSTESPSNNTYYSTKNPRNMGGILYNGFANSDKVVPGVTMHYLGEVSDVDDYAITFEDGSEEVQDQAFTVEIDRSYSSYSPINSDAVSVKYGFYFPDQDKFYFGDELAFGGANDDEDDDEGDDITTELIDNCDILQLYSSEQLYQTVFYSDIGYLYFYMPNSVPIGTQIHVDVSVIGLGDLGVELTSADQVVDGDPYYDEDRWGWRIPISSAGNYSVRANSYAGEFINLDGTYVDGYEDQVCEPGGYDFGQIVINNSDINQSLLCPQLEAASSYVVSEDPNSQGLEGLGVVTINIAEGILQDSDFSSPGSSAYLINPVYQYGIENVILEPSSITYDPSSGTEIVFEGVPPNTPNNPFWSFRFNNVGCNETFISWSDGNIYVPPPGSESVCEVLLSGLEEAALIGIGDPSSAPSNLDYGISTPTLNNPKFRFLLDSDFPELLSGILDDNGLEEDLITEYVGEVGTGSLGFSLRMTAIRLDDATNSLTEDVYDLGTSNNVTVAIAFQDEDLVITEPGNYAMFLSLATCSSSSDDYGIQVSTDYYPGPPLGDCNEVFSPNPSSTSNYNKYSFANTRGATVISGQDGDTTAQITFEIAGIRFSGFPLDNFVFFLSGSTVSSAGTYSALSGVINNLPHIDNSVPIHYVQDGGQNFENDNGITTTFSYLEDGLGSLRIVVKYVPLSPEFDTQDPDTYATHYSWGLLSKSCVNSTDYDGGFYLSDPLWSDTYGVSGSIVADSMMIPGGGSIKVTAEVTVEVEEEPVDPNSPTFLPDFNNADVLTVLADTNNDGEIGSSDILDYLAYFGSVVDPDLTPETAPPSANVVYNESGQYYIYQGDLNGDGQVGSNDLLSFLASFGQNVDYEAAGLYSEDPTQARASSNKLSTVSLVDLSSSSYSLSNIPASISDGFPNAYTKTSPTSASIVMTTVDEDVTTYVKSENFPSNAQLFAFVSPELSGDELRGQTAELLLDLGQEDFELFAVNLNYELLNADHTK